MHLIAEFTSRIKPMRVGLIVLALLVSILAPAPGTPVELDGWAVMRTLLLPALAPLIWLVLLLDTLMARVMLGSVDDSEKPRYRYIIRTNLVIVVVVAALWSRYFAALFQ